MRAIQRRVDSPYEEDTDLPILYRKKLPLITRIRRWAKDVSWYVRKPGVT
jgi:hypothetical protein